MEFREGVLVLDDFAGELTNVSNVNRGLAGDGDGVAAATATGAEIEPSAAPSSMNALEDSKGTVTSTVSSTIRIRCARVVGNIWASPSHEGLCFLVAEPPALDRGVLKLFWV